MADGLPDFEVVTTEDVTPEIITLIKSLVTSHYEDEPIDWEDIWDRAEKRRLDDGRGIDMGTDLGSPAIVQIKKEIRTWRRTG
ncbi:hypothetical protein [Streptomyces sp. MMBL 11-1]|uniref:hypothetical protein n=1 Tax=Streptomyces sp. MMBL 11-1 TaxID=3026420 RepID=UPI002362F438|nr:hypothetical protein [Streptomyces sp. MMBL 11-1]